MATHLQLTHSHFFLPCHNFSAVTPQPCISHFRRYHRRSIFSAFSASSTSNSSVGGGRKQARKSNVDLCNDLRQVMAEIGVPDGQVPSLKDLSQHGRQDLANVVRRKGYKLIRELLATTQQIKVADCDVEGSLTEDKVSNEQDESIGLNENEKELAEDVLFSCQDTIIEETSDTNNFDNDSTSDVESFFLVDSSTKSSLQEKVAKFIQSGELEAVEDDDFDVENEKENSGSQNSIGSEISSASEEPNDQVHYVSANGSALTSQIVNSTSQLRNITSSDQLASEESSNTDSDVKVEIRTQEDQAEINRIKVMLHHKEFELSQLKEQIEKNKQALSEFQDRAEAEISKAQKLLLDKDAELLAAEESLSGLKQVQVEYWGEGETVEVAGSFNGWHHGVKLDPQPSSNITNPVELRNSKHWKSMLWLYPGIYEIKFVVDGKWMIDPMKEVVYRGSIQNNVLRVDR